jgi:hypothetical protein
MNRTPLILLVSALVLSNLIWIAQYRSLDLKYMQEMGLRSQADAMLRKLIIGKVSEIVSSRQAIIELSDGMPAVCDFSNQPIKGDCVTASESEAGKCSDTGAQKDCRP